MSDFDSAFDPESFKTMEVEGASSTQYIPIPENPDGYVGVIKKVDFRSGVGKESGKPWAACDVYYSVDDAQVKELLDQEDPTVRQTIFLDLKEGGSLNMSKGKNVQLGKLREAVGQNDPSRPWAFSMLEGQAARIFVKVKDDQEGVPRSEVKVVAKL